MLDSVHEGKLVRVRTDAFSPGEFPDVLALRGEEGEILSFYPDGSITLAIGGQIAYLAESDLEELE